VSIRHLLTIVALGLAACAPVNPRLSTFDPNAGYRYEPADGSDGDASGEETFVVLTFSGGGTRAAAFAYGVLQELRDTPIGGTRTLLDEVDVISSVSGGSFAAAYYGLFGPDAFFVEFPNAVLYRKLEWGLLLRMLAPWNWPALLSPYYGRGDLAEAYYDADIFQHLRFSDLQQRRATDRHHKRPFIILNATDISRGAQFSFTQEYFDRICSDLSGVSVSRGVTASSAFPVAFTPLTVKNYGQAACDYDAPWVGNALEDLDTNPQLYALARTWQSYADAARRPYIHLSDGGLSDNIGLRAFDTAVSGTASIDLFSKVNRHRVKRVAVIVVDARPEEDAAADRSARPPGIYTVLNAAGTNPMENYSSETVERVRLWFKEWDQAAAGFEVRRSGCDQLAQERCAASRHPPTCEATERQQCYVRLNATDQRRPPHPELFLVHVRFESIPDPEAKQRLKKVPTRLQLPREDVDALVLWGRALLRGAQPYQDLVASLRTAAPAGDISSLKNSGH
jgi:NTE family protein